MVITDRIHRRVLVSMLRQGWRRLVKVRHLRCHQHLLCHVQALYLCASQPTAVSFTITQIILSVSLSASVKPVSILHLNFNSLRHVFHYYFRNVNEVNGRDNVFLRCGSVFLCMRSGPVNQTTLKRLKWRTSNLACMFPATIRTWSFWNFFEKVAWPGSRSPLNFWALNANSSKWL